MWNKLFINFYAASTDDDMKKAALIFVNEGKRKNHTVQCIVTDDNKIQIN